MDNHSVTNGNISQDVNEAKITLYGVLLVLSLFGNVLVIAVIFYNEHLRTCFNYLIVNMSMSDLLIPLLALPIRISEQAGLRRYEWLIDGIPGTVLCKLCYFLTDIATAVSIFTLVIVACERALAIVFTMRVHPLNKRRTFILIGSTWILSTAIYSPYFQFHKLTNVGPYNMCGLTSWEDKNTFYSITMVVVFVIPCIFITFLYIIIICKIRKTTKNIVTMLDPRQARSRHRRDQQVFRLSAVIIIVFYAFWGPFFVYGLLVTFKWKFNIPTYVDNMTIMTVVDTLALVNSSINPFIYFFFQKNYQQGLKRVLRRVFRKKGPGEDFGTSLRTLKGTTKTKCSSERRNLTLKMDSRDSENIQ